MITISWPWELPDKIDGIAVVCDAWGATTNITTLLSKGVKQLLFLMKKSLIEVKNVINSI